MPCDAVAADADADPATRRPTAPAARARSWPRRLAALAFVAAAVALAGCSTLRLAYNSAPQLAWWWVDGYLDFGAAQQGPARESLERWFEWHRATQLEGYAAWLESIEPRVGEPLDADTACALSEQARLRLRPAFDRAFMHAAELMPQLGPAQVRAMQAKYAKSNAEFRRDFVQAPADERRARSVERTVENFERVYGRLEEPQRRIIEASIASSPFDPPLALADREHRQGLVLASLRRWLEQRPEPAQALSALRQLALDVETPRSPELQSHQRRLTVHGCRLVADVHNSTGPEQRARARRQLQTWKADLRALARQRTD